MSTGERPVTRPARTHSTAAPDRVSGDVQADGGAARLRACGERIERLLENGPAGGMIPRGEARELVRLLVEVYGAGLERVLDLVDEAGLLDDALLDRLAADGLVAGLLLVHGLHPYGVRERVERALAQVRPYLASHGGDVELVEVTDAGVARLRMLGSCDGCPSSAATLSLAVHQAVEAAAPELTGIEAEGAAEAVSDGGLIPADALTVRLRTPRAEAAAR